MKKYFSVFRWLGLALEVLLLVFFFLPWVSVLGISASGFTLTKSVLGLGGLLGQFDMNAAGIGSGVSFLVAIWIGLPILFYLINALLFGINSKKSGGMAATVLILTILQVLLQVAFVIIVMIGGAGYISIGVGLILTIIFDVFALVDVILLLTALPSGDSAQTAQGDISHSGIIIGVSGMYKDAKFEFSNGEPIVFGRDSALSNVVINVDAEKVSRKHCQVVFSAEDQQYIVTDFSKNGTYLQNGTRLPVDIPTKVPCGTILLLGNDKNRLNLY